MNDRILAALAWVLFPLWLLVILPGWVFGMLYSGRFLLVPDMPVGVEFLAFVAAMYLPPIITGLAAYRKLKAKRQSHA